MQHPDFFNFGADVVDHRATVHDKDALIWCNESGEERRLRFSDVSRLSAALASSLSRLGVAKGDRVMVMLPRIPEWQIAMVACLKLGAIAIPCIEMLSAKDIAYRIARSGARAVITTASQTAKFQALLDDVAIRISVGQSEGWLEVAELMISGAEDFVPARVAADDPAILYFTSGSTGQPKGVLHASRGIWHWRHSAVEWLDLKPEDLIWCTADTGWSKAGTSILLGPWSCGSTALFYDGPFDAGKRLELLSRYRVSVYCAAGTEILRLLDEPIADCDLRALRRTVSAGEAVAETAVRGWRDATGLTIAEAYGQTETLMSLGHRPCTVRKPQAMGVPLAHNEIAVIDEAGAVLPDGEIGELAIRVPNPQVMIGYWDDPERTESCYIDGPDGRWFRTGDRAERDSDGHFFHRGRNDDVINSSGYRIGPAEVEDVLLAHPSVAEAAAVGAPDAKRGEIVVACVVLREGEQPSDALAESLKTFVKEQTAPYKYPRSVQFMQALPKTLTGKIQRNVLRAALAKAADGKGGHND